MKSSRHSAPFVTAICPKLANLPNNHRDEREQQNSLTSSMWRVTGTTPSSLLPFPTSLAAALAATALVRVSSSLRTTASVLSSVQHSCTACMVTAPSHSLFYNGHSALPQMLLVNGPSTIPQTVIGDWSLRRLQCMVTAPSLRPSY